VAGWCLYQWTHSAVASTGGVDVRPGLEVLPVVVIMGVDDLLRGSRRPRDADTLSLCAHDLIGLTQLSLASNTGSLIRVASSVVVPGLKPPST